MQEIFTEYFNTNFRADKESVSGPGSNSEQTARIVELLPSLFHEMNIVSLLDIPCGDFNRQRKIDFGSIKYIGADIVQELIEQNKTEFTGYCGQNIDFEVLDITKDKLPAVSLIMVRDCLVHFSDADIFKALRNICKSGSMYLLMTNFPGSTNKQIETGSRHTIDREQPPFNFPKPIYTLNEACTEGGGIYKNKSLCLWKVSDIQTILSNKPKHA